MPRKTISRRYYIGSLARHPKSLRGSQVITAPMTRPTKNPLKLRSRARRAVLQALYQWQMSGRDTGIAGDDFLAQWEFPPLDEDYFRELTREIPQAVARLDERLAPVISRPLNQTDPVERAILWIGVYELVFRPDIPWRVVINESVELAKTFGAQQSHKYINGILDKLAKAARG
uniref:Transcription antitermination protein NusB n=1 Tax=Candidatus Kentrum sp. DK TaxID=2126562 RepID=A0A450S1W9_9GAMM|nr:MAG: NusB antitermination factor [Candidatus Kentron sp. DK]